MPSRVARHIRFNECGTFLKVNKTRSIYFFGAYHGCICYSGNKHHRKGLIPSQTWKHQDNIPFAQIIKQLQQTVDIIAIFMLYFTRSWVSRCRIIFTLKRYVYCFVSCDYFILMLHVNINSTKAYNSGAITSPDSTDLPSWV